MSTTKASGGSSKRAGRRLLSRPAAAIRRAVPRNIPGTTVASEERAERPASNGYFLLFMVIAVLCAVGLMMVLSSSSVVALRSYGDSWLFFRRQVLWIVLGSIALWAALRLDYQTWRRWGRPTLYLSLFLLFLVLIPGIGIEVAGSRRWLGAGAFRMQPSEIAKWAMLIVSADLLARRHDVINVARLTLRPVLLLFGVTGGLIMLEPDMGTTLILGGITVVVLFVAGTPIKWMGRLALVAVAGASVLAIVEPYRRARLLSFTDPFSDASAGGYQVVQSVYAIGSGGLTGVGLGASRAKWGFLPHAHTDFIFAIIGEELGLLGAVAIVALFIGLALLGIRAANRAPDRFGMLLASGITAWILMQAFLNIGAVIGILPVTGVPLPFISQGGSSLIILMAATGVLLNIARQGEEGGPRGREAPTPDRLRRVFGAR